MRRFSTFMILLILLAMPCFAADPCNNFTIILFGRVWQVDSYWVQEDILTNPNDEAFLEPEGMAFKDGVLYVSGDRESYEADGRLAVYQYPATGPLSYDSYIQIPNTDPDWWGPEGLTFNDSSDPSSYGYGTNQLVSIEADNPPQIGVIDLSSGGVSSKMPIAVSEDIAFVTTHSEFAILSDAGTSGRIDFYDNTMTSTGQYFDVIGGSRGLAAVDSSFGSWFTRTSQTDEGFIVSQHVDPNNAILTYDISGNPVGKQYALPTEPKSQIPLGGGFYLVEPAFGSVEAVAVDETNHVVFLGDEENCMIHVLKPLRLAADLYTDGIVDINDLSIFCSQWLNIACDNPDWCNDSDLDRNTKVEFVDFANFAAQWGEQEIL